LQEVVYYRDPTVVITNARAILGGVTYSIANISSVRVVTKHSWEQFWAICLIFPGVIFYIVPALFGIWLLAAKKVKPDFCLIIIAGQEIRGLIVKGNEVERIYQIANAISQAIISRS